MEKLQNFFKQGYLIALEGIDGSGKTTLARSLYERLKHQGISALLTKEPGATEFGKEIRAMIQNPKHSVPPLAEFFLFAADRAAHIQHVVKPALAAGKMVICDRMADSSIAYQAFGRGIPVQDVATVNTIALQGIQPHITFYLDIDYATAHERIMQRNEALSQFDQEKEGFFRKVKEGYEFVYKNRSDVMKQEQVAALIAALQAGRQRPYDGSIKVFYLDAPKSPAQLLEEVMAILAWTRGTV
jgi:dTMP kinase